MTDSEPRSDLLPSATKDHTKCEKCGATIRLDTGICVSCLLREGLQRSDDVSQAFFQTVLAEVDAPDKTWFLGNYEILEQIGSGGMGVIYRARQRHSRRIVAVKRVLSYRADSHEALERFRREAQAVASLDHPNILPIYEVSESEDGLPFFSMKFAENGSLQENAPSLRNAPRTCVQLMAKVARAVEYAHSRGVLDRDLETICARCLERDPKARYQSAGDLAADLERWLDGRPIVARPVSPPARMWRWSQRNPKLVGAAVAGLLLGAATVWPFRGELFRPSQFNPPDRGSGVGFSVPVQNQFNPFTVPDYTSPGDFVARRPDTRVTGAPPETGFITGVPDRPLEAGLRTNKITADVIAAPPKTAFNISARDRALEASLR